MVSVKVYFVDGSVLPIEEDGSFLVKLKKLQAQGFEGRELVDRLISDDWGAPPKFVLIEAESIEMIEIRC